MKHLALGLMAVCLAWPATAQQVGDCDWRSSAAALYEPWEEFSKTFSNGKVRIALIDTIEPGLSPVHVLVLSPPYDELGARQCRILSHQDGRGFADADFSTLQSDYDPAVGLTFSIDVKVFDGEIAQPRVLRFTLNQATGTIEAQLR